MADTAIIRSIFTSERVEAWRKRYFWPNAVFAVLGLSSFLLFEGKVFPDAAEAWIGLFQAVCLAALAGETVGVYFMARGLRRGLGYTLLDTIGLFFGLGVAAVLLLLFVTDSLSEDATLTGFGYVARAGLIGFAISRMLRLFQFLTRLARSPLLVFVGSFVTLIICGAGLLMLPGARSPGFDLTFVEAVFMSTSATCVTGHNLLDLGRDLTRFGQLVILTLVQIGGLGIMTFAAFFSLLFGRGIGVRDAVAVGEMLNVDMIGRVGRTTAWILGITLACEAVGAALLYGNWVDRAGVSLPAGEQLYYSVFHAVSGFCNAGFGLHGDNLARYDGAWPVILTMGWLIVMGGLGFPVVQDIVTYRFWAHPLARRIPLLRRKVRNQPIPRLTLQTKIVLLSTAALLVLGAAAFYALEWDNTLAGLSAPDAWLGAFFGGLTPRTAGFNTVDVNAMKPETKYLTILLMMIGASPGGTGGGLKTTTFAVMLLAVLATVRGRTPQAFSRRVPEGLVRKSLVMLVLVLLFVNMATMALLITESGGVAARQWGFENITFEAVSAICTVGLSTGITPELTTGGKLIIIVAMFVGRVGPLTLVLAIGSKKPQRFEYPDEGVMIG